MKTYENPTILQRLYRFSNRSAGDFACWPWTGKRDSANRGTLSIPNGGKGTKRRAYQVMWEAYRCRELEPGEQINHLCDNPLCVNPFHLYQGTQSENRLQRRDWTPPTEAEKVERNMIYRARRDEKRRRGYYG